MFLNYTVSQTSLNRLILLSLFGPSSVWFKAACCSADEDSNGTIDNEELKRCLQKLEFHCTEQEIRDLFESCDVDGSNGIQFNEFIVLLCLIYLLDGPSSSSHVVNDHLLVYSNIWFLDN